MVNLRPIVFFVGFFVLLVYNLQAQHVVINEIMSSNSKTIADEDGDYEDWIEIYNPGSEPLNLEGYGLSDLPGPSGWIFPSVVIQPGEYLLVWASGKDRRPEGEAVYGVMRSVYKGIPGLLISDLINHNNYPGKPDESQLVTAGFHAPINVGDHYGQRMHSYLQAPQTGNYVFWIASDDEGLLMLSTDSKPLNAVEIARVPGWTNPMEWNKYPQQQSANIWLEQGKRYYIKALMKEGEGGDNLTVRWQLPSGAIEQPIPNFRLYWQQTELHTNFRLSREGQFVQLTHPDGSVMSQVQAPNLPADVSYGPKPDASGSWFYFDQPTPGKSNATDGAAGILNPPFFSSPGGIYAQDFDLSIFHTDPQVAIVYTLDGSEPSVDNLNGSTYQYKRRYRVFSQQQDGELINREYKTIEKKGPIAIVDRTGISQSQTTINTRFDPLPVIPLELPLTGTVIRAKAFKQGFIPSETITNTYIVKDTPYHVPVVSLVLPEKSFFAYSDGIYVPGATFDYWRAENWQAPVHGNSPANFNNTGLDWERETNIEFFDTLGTRILDQRAGIRIHGGWSRSFPQKALRLYARGSYATEEFKLKLFPHKDTNQFRRFVMRASGNDFDATFFRDAFIHQLVKNRPIDIQHWQPVVTFLNGEYWGILNIRDRNDQYYLSGEHHIDPQDLDILTANAMIKQGGNQHYLDMMDYVVKNDLSIDNHYEVVNTLMDVDNFAEYYAIQIYINNKDWPHNNIDFWRKNTTGYSPEAPFGHDGRWRWMIYDTDFGFWIWDMGPWENTLVHASQSAGDPWSTRLFRNLLENQGFRNKMVNRFADLMNSVFYPDTVKARVDAMQAIYEPLMDAQIARWRTIPSKNNWYYEINKLRSFAEQRPSHMRNHIGQYFGLGGHFEITINVGSGKGKVRINSLELDNPEHWKGIYFNGVPVEIEAIAAKNYKFSHWEGASGSLATTITHSSDEDFFIEAHFEKNDQHELITFWLFDESLLNDTPLEQVDDSYHAHIQTKVNFHSALQGYPFHPGHLSWRKASLERRNMPTDINYRPLGNQGIEYQLADLRGLQVKQPFKGDHGENTLLFHLPSNGYGDLIFRFAAKDENAARFLLIDYSVDEGVENWIEPSLESSSLVLTEEYQLYEINFLGIKEVENNPWLKIRIRFGGNDMTADHGGRVVFNNISLDGVPLDHFNLPPRVSTALSLLKGIEQGEAMAVNLDAMFEDPEGDPLHFLVSSSRPDFVQVNQEHGNLQLIPLKRGDAHITVTANDGMNLPIEHSFRVLVYPMAHPLVEGSFMFTDWDASQQELTYPENMLFLQSDRNDPALSHALLFPYHIEHADYHPADQATTGFPYNNTARTRINGLGESGISFINTGVGRDLGGALVAINTKGMDNLRIRWTAGTMIQNERVYAVRLQYRTGTQGAFSDIVHNRQISQYIPGIDEYQLDFAGVKMPEQALDQEYVQLLWKYYPITGDSGPRAQIRLDNIIIGDLLSDDALIESFGFEEEAPLNVIIDNERLEITVFIQGHRHSLTPVISISDKARINPPPGASGSYIPLDFTNPIQFAVTSESGLVINNYMVTVETSVSLEDRDISNIIVFPNPASGFLNILADGLVKSTEIFNSLGHLVYLPVYQDNQNRISVEHLNSGIYFIRIHTDNGVHVRKILIKR